MKTNQKGFSAVELLIVLVVIGLIGGASWYVWQSHHKTTATTSPVTDTQAIQTKPTTAAAKDPYAGWPTYTSKLNSGLTFRYPPNWVFAQPAEVFKNNNGGEELEATLYSAEPTRDPAPAGASAPSPANNVYMCVSFDEYGGPWSFSNWYTNKSPVATEQFKVNSTNITLATYAGANSMQSDMVLNTPNNSTGDHFVATRNGYVVSVHAIFNCHQADGKILETMTDNFADRPEVKTANQMMQSIKF